MHILLSLSFHLYLLYLLLNSCNGNDGPQVTWSSASLNMVITKCHRWSCWSMEKVIMCMC